MCASVVLMLFCSPNEHGHVVTWMGDAEEGSVTEFIQSIPAYTIKMAGIHGLPDECIKQIKCVLLTHMLCCSTNTHGHVEAWTGEYREGSVMDVILVILAYTIRTASIHTLTDR